MRVIAIKLLSKLNSLYQNGDVDNEEKDKIGNLIADAVKKNDKKIFINGISRFQKATFYSNEAYEEMLKLVQ